VRQIPTYKINNFQTVHRLINSANHVSDAAFHDSLKVKGFALFSTVGAKETISPTKADFFRVSLCTKGTANVSLGLETFVHQQGSISFTFPNQLFSKESQSDEFLGYYLFFTSDFLSDFIAPAKIEIDFPFFSFSGRPFFQLNEIEFNDIQTFFHSIHQELSTDQPDSVTAIQLYLYLLLIQAKRSYLRQDLGQIRTVNQQQTLVYRFKKLVSQHFLTYRHVSNYAEMLAVTPNYLNRVIKKETAATASYFINQMLLTEAKALLKHSDLSITAIAYHLSFSDTAHFSRFFKQHLLVTPSEYRQPPSA